MVIKDFPGFLVSAGAPMHTRQQCAAPGACPETAQGTGHAGEAGTVRPTNRIRHIHAGGKAHRDVQLLSPDLRLTGC